MKVTLMTASPRPRPTCPSWQEPKRLSSGDKIWILTDVETSTSSFYSWSTEQEWFTVGAYDFRSECIGFFKFSLDDGRGLLRAGLPAPPWNAPQVNGIEVSRLAHDNGEAKGRFVVTVKLVDIDPKLLAITAAAKRAFWDAGLNPNAEPGMWSDLVAAVVQEKKIESAALGRTGLFTAKDVEAVVGGGVNVLPVLKRLVNDGRLERFGRTRGTQYLVR